MTYRQKLWLATTFCGGILVGGTAVYGYHRIADKNAKYVFEQRIRCKEFAEQYAAKNSDERHTYWLEQSNWSPVKNTCVASFASTGTPFEEYLIIDVISGANLHYGGCIANTDCGNGHNVKLGQERDAFFAQLVGAE